MLWSRRNWYFFMIQSTLLTLKKWYFEKVLFCDPLNTFNFDKGIPWKSVIFVSRQYWLLWKNYIHIFLYAYLNDVLDNITCINICRDAWYVMRFCLIRDHIVCLFSDCVGMCIQLSVFALSCFYYGPMALQYWIKSINHYYYYHRLTIYLWFIYAITASTTTTSTTNSNTITKTKTTTTTTSSTSSTKKKTTTI